MFGAYILVASILAGIVTGACMMLRAWLGRSPAQQAEYTRQLHAANVDLSPKWHELPGWQCTLWIAGFIAFVIIVLLLNYA